MKLGKSVRSAVRFEIVNKSQVAQLSAIVQNVPDTFTITSQVNEGMGNFKRLDVHGNKEMELLDSGSAELR